MKALIWLLTLTLGVIVCTTAQEKVLAKIHYHYTHIHDTGRHEHSLKDELVTYAVSTNM
ncbi:MAG TPA: hypothetical protein PKA53_00245 [Sphingobacterium sp.]|nr:hypothetical protein [Sphingobacterium sp.]